MTGPHEQARRTGGRSGRSVPGQRSVRSWYDRTWPQISVAATALGAALLPSGGVVTACASGGAVVAAGAVGRWCAGSPVPLAPRPLPALTRTASLPTARRSAREHAQAAQRTSALAALERLRAALTQEVVTVGELLASHAPTLAPDEKRALTELTRALDSYQAAGKLLDEAVDLLDLTGVLVLAGDTRQALVNSLARHHDTAAGPRTRACFFNPLHGRSPHTVSWRTGRQARLQVPVCAGCRRILRRGGTPEALPDVTAGGHIVPYYAVDPDRSVWAATGFGTVRTDLAARVQRGDHRRRHDG